MRFTKVQGAGNDFILIEAGSLDWNWAELAAAMCDRHYGIGGDGLLLLLPSAAADFRMAVFNADGSEAEACGNGLRCFCRYLLDRGLVAAGTDRISVETKAGISKVRLHRTGDVAPAIQVALGVPIFTPRDIPVTVEPAARMVDINPVLDYRLSVAGEGLALSFVSLGNPHAVHFYPYPVADFPLSRVGPEVERHPMFPHRVNFEVAQVINRRQIEARIWERGVGETLASGTGSSAIAVAARLHGYCGDKVDIILRGGILKIEWDGTGEVFLSGPAEIVFNGEWPVEVKAR